MIRLGHRRGTVRGLGMSSVRWLTTVGLLVGVGRLRVVGWLRIITRRSVIPSRWSTGVTGIHVTPGVDTTTSESLVPRLRTQISPKSLILIGRHSSSPSFQTSNPAQHSVRLHQVHGCFAERSPAAVHPQAEADCEHAPRLWRYHRFGDSCPALPCRR